MKKNDIVSRFNKKEIAKIKKEKNEKPENVEKLQMKMENAHNKMFSKLMKIE